MALLAAILCLIVLPFIVNSDIRSTDFRPLMKFTFWCFVVVTFILGWIGAKTYCLSVFNYWSNSYLFLLFHTFGHLPFIAWLERVLWDEKQ